MKHARCGCVAFMKVPAVNSCGGLPFRARKINSALSLEGRRLARTIGGLVIKHSFSLVLLATLWGCSSPKASVDSPTGGTGSESGGSSTSGGTTAEGGSTSPQGGTAMGGTVGKGGSTGKGGSAATGGKSASGGTTATGGSMATGGTPPTGPTGPAACGLDSAAFCEDFESPQPGGRGGDIDEKKWSVARWSMSDWALFARNPAFFDLPKNAVNSPTFCGMQFSGTLPPDDMKLCPGITSGATSTQFSELLADGDGFGLNSMRVRQPFDFTGRTGTFVFEVDAKRNKGFDGHGWWTEFWITKDPAPLPYHGAPTVGSYPTDAIGFQIAPNTQACFNDVACNEVGHIFLARDYTITRDAGLDSEPLKTADGKTNRFKVVINKDTCEVWATDFDAPTKFKKLVTATGLNLRFQTGYVHLQHSQYNAQKGGGATTAQTYRWDNVGFDGPILPTPRGYDAPDNGKRSDGGFDMGYSVPASGKAQAITIPGVDLTGATKAVLNINMFTNPGGTLRYKLNGNAAHTFTIPAALNDGELLRTFTIEVPMAELVAGDNKLEVDQPSPQLISFVGNIDITVQ